MGLAVPRPAMRCREERVIRARLLWARDRQADLQAAGMSEAEAIAESCHHARMGHRHPMVWNIAADYAINQSLIDTGFTLPKNCLLDAKYKDMSAERIYEELMKNAKFISMSAPGDGDGQPQPGDGAG